MSKVFKISDDTTTIDLLDNTSPGISAHGAGIQTAAVTPHQYDQLGGLEDRLFIETYRTVVQGSSDDNLATQTRDLIALLRKAWRYHNDPSYTVPVYLQAQTTGESNERYALVFQCPEITYPDLYGPDVDYGDLLGNLGVTIVRGIWRDDKPGNLGSAVTLVESDGTAASPTKVHISNFRDDVDITHFKQDDGGVFTDISTGDTLWPATPAQNDSLFIGSTDQPLHTIVIPALSTAGVMGTSTPALYYYVGTSATALTLGTNYTVYPGADLEASFEQNSEDIVINVDPPTNFTKTTIDSVNAFWYEIQEDNAAPSYSTRPILNATQAIYAQSHPYIEIGTSALSGDVPPFLSMRLHAPAGGDENEAFSSLSRVIMGSKTQPGNFVSHLNLGTSANPAAWTATQGTDATSTADVKAPEGYRSDVDFAGDATMIKRVTLAGDAILTDWIGEYRAFVRAEQSGGSSGDCRVQLRTFIHESNDYSPKFTSPVVAVAGVDEGLEVIDLGKIQLPFSSVVNADGFTSADLIFEVHAEDTVGNATLGLYDLVLIPVDEWSVELDDPVSDSVSGASALRGGNVLEVDGGVLADRTQKYIKSGANLYIAERWGRGGPPPMLDPGTNSRLYFLIMHYPTTFGTPPLVAPLGCHLAFEMYGQDLYLSLRGND